MRDISKDELKEILRKHTLWVECEEGGERADLQRADLQRADLRGADLREADLQEADLREADLREADLQRVNLQEADLRGANLQEADLDYSCWPLWCGSLDVKVDVRLAAQLSKLHPVYRILCQKPGVCL